MYELFQAMLWPIMAGLLLPPFLIYFGLGLLERRNPFAALAFPQLAVLGTTTAVQFTSLPFGSSLLLTLLAALGAAFLSDGPSRRREFLCAAAFLIALPITVALFARETESMEEARHLLSGSLLLVNKRTVLRSFEIGLASALLAAILLRLLPPGRIREFAFYGLYSAGVCGVVSIGSVLLTFLYTLGPALCASYLAVRLLPRLILGSMFAAGCTVATIYTAYRNDLPASPVLGTFFLGALLVTILYRRFSPSRS
jgi:ABC-type Mn2+/Zn2+ transport system permease subunit